MFENTEAGSKALGDLITALAVLGAELDELPPPESGDYYAMLTPGLLKNLPPVYDAYDRYLAEVLISEKRKVTCSKGCSACCRHFVSSVEPFELIALDHHLKSRPDYSDLIVSMHRKAMIYDGILREEGPRDPEEAEDRALYRYFLRGQPCSFLNEDGTCGVYEWRPMSCRMFFAESPPRFCAGKELATPWNRNFQIELPLEAEEALARCSQRLAALGLSEHLFPGLLGVNETFGRYETPFDPSEPPSDS